MYFLDNFILFIEQFFWSNFENIIKNINLILENVHKDDASMEVNLIRIFSKIKYNNKWDID